MSAENEHDQAQAVAAFLASHPKFFIDHGSVLANLSIPAPHGGRAISLHERQLEVLREKNRALEMRLAELMRNGQENDAIIEKMQRWTRQLLLSTDPAELPALVTNGMTEIFSVPQVSLRLWGLRAEYQNAPFAQVSADAEVAQINELVRPRCGDGKDLAARGWLPAQGGDTRSMALLPLRKGAGPKAFGALALGSADADRFRAGMGTAFLERIAETASAALSRLVE